jgi:hypothetical protein
MKNSLTEIERAVRANFVINHDGEFLEADDKVERDMKFAARMVFIGVSMTSGHSITDILAHSGIGLAEFNKLLRIFHSHLREGNVKAEERHKEHKVQYAQTEAFDPHLRIYRKTLLVNNYLNNLKRLCLHL